MLKKLAPYKIKKIMREVLGEEYIQKEAINYMVDRAAQFVKNVTRNAIEELHNDRNVQRTIQTKHLQSALSDIKKILSNLPSDVCGEDK